MALRRLGWLDFVPLPNAEVYLSPGQLPALTPLESAVARAWLVEHSQQYDGVMFNVRLGEGIQLPPGAPEFMRQYARASTTKRADMILFQGADVTIVEVKIRIGGGALGQLLTYKALYQSEHPDVKVIHMIAAGQTIELDVRRVLESNSVTVELFPLASAV